MESKAELDARDWQLLEALQADARLGYAELGRLVRLSAPAVAERVKRLEEAGVIKGYRALLDAKALGYTLMALIYISMDKHTPDRFEYFEKEISQFSEVLECLLITGQDADYQIKVIVRDMDAFQELLLNRITGIRGVTGVHSSFVLRRVVDTTSIPV